MAALDLTALEVANRGGPPRGTLREIVNARRRPRKSTLNDIDTVLGWPPGVAKDILDGNRPAPQADQWLDRPDENRRGLMRSHLLRLRKEQYRLSETHRRHADLIGQLVELLDAQPPD
ncbi:hypothetical protein C1Y40_00619 [Mycobacterium talmoniae]|uniref:Uncharacterized protein n=1 Tax=Mycobacterium talmoniae TaxID=1858794 RepID=A0A2S8BR94_9MYCO|nr:hypothetical protein C1Y40_00619 [Mycobacterium talmoniae]